MPTSAHAAHKCMYALLSQRQIWIMSEWIRFVRRTAVLNWCVQCLTMVNDISYEMIALILVILRDRSVHLFSIHFLIEILGILLCEWTKFWLINQRYLMQHLSCQVFVYTSKTKRTKVSFRLHIYIWCDVHHTVSIQTHLPHAHTQTHQTNSNSVAVVVIMPPSITAHHHITNPHSIQSYTHKSKCARTHADRPPPIRTSVSGLPCMWLVLYVIMK